MTLVTSVPSDFSLTNLLDDRLIARSGWCAPHQIKKIYKWHWFDSKKAHTRLAECASPKLEAWADWSRLWWYSPVYRSCIGIANMWRFCTSPLKSIQGSYLLEGFFEVLKIQRTHNRAKVSKFFISNRSQGTHTHFVLHWTHKLPQNLQQGYFWALGSPLQSRCHHQLVHNHFQDFMFAYKNFFSAVQINADIVLLLSVQQLYRCWRWSWLFLKWILHKSQRNTLVWQNLSLDTFFLLYNRQ